MRSREYGMPSRSSKGSQKIHKTMWTSGKPGTESSAKPSSSQPLSEPKVLSVATSSDSNSKASATHPDKSSPDPQSRPKLTLMTLPDEILTLILEHLLKSANIHYSISGTTLDLLANPYRCKTLCITAVSRKLHYMAWDHLNRDCRFTTDHLSLRGQDHSTLFFLDRNGDVKEWEGIMSFKKVEKLIIFPSQHSNMDSKAKRIHPFLIRFPKLRHLTLELHWERYTSLVYLRDNNTVDWAVWIIREMLYKDYPNEIENFIESPPKQRLLASVEKKININFTYQDKKECVATVTKEGTMVTKGGIAGPKLWKSIWDDVLNIKGIPLKEKHSSKSWYSMWREGGAAYKKWEDKEWEDKH